MGTNIYQTIRPMMRKTLALILLLYPLFLSSQIESKRHSLSGQVRIIIGTDTVTPVNRPIVRLSGTKQGVLTDSLGNFTIKGLASNKVKINLMGHGYSADTIVEIRNKSVENFTIFARTDCNVNRRTAERDIRMGNVNLLLTTGFIPSAATPNDKDFEKQYKIEYYDYGYLSPAVECLIQYNRRIFEHLDSRYGREWRTKVRKDVRGL